MKKEGRQVSRAASVESGEMQMVVTSSLGFHPGDIVTSDNDRRYVILNIVDNVVDVAPYGLRRSKGWRRHTRRAKAVTRRGGSVPRP